MKYSLSGQSRCTTIQIQKSLYWCEICAASIIQTCLKDHHTTIQTSDYQKYVCTRVNTIYLVMKSMICDTTDAHAVSSRRYISCRSCVPTVGMSGLWRIVAYCNTGLYPQKHQTAHIIWQSCQYSMTYSWSDHRYDQAAGYHRMAWTCDHHSVTDLHNREYNRC